MNILTKPDSLVAMAMSESWGNEIGDNFKTDSSKIESGDRDIAIIGSGMAGLSAAWFLTRSGFRCTVFEKASVAGMAAHSRDFGSQLGFEESTATGDVPSRMFNQSLWPSVHDLYCEAGVEFEPVDHWQTFFDETQTLLRLGLPYNAISLLKLTMSSNSRQLLSDLRKFQSEGSKLLANRLAASISFGQLLQSSPFVDLSSIFINQFLLPALTTTVFTCPEKELREFPADVVLSALAKIVGDTDGTDAASTLLRTSHGTFDVAKRLLADVAKVNFSTSVNRVFQSSTDCVFVSTDQGDFPFDHAIIATQANHVRKLYDHSTATDLLDQFHYVDVPVVVHTDDAVMPTRSKDWSTFNFRTSTSSQSQDSTCTVWMNRFHSNWPQGTNLFQSIFPAQGIDDSKIIASANLQRPVVNEHSEILYSQLDRIHAEPDRRIWFAGSYAARGVPLLESAVVSSKNVTRRIREQVARTHERAL